MSYILDALRRADAERDRGEVPGLHTQQFGVLPGDDEAPRRPRLLIFTIVVLVIALVGALAWNFFGASDAAPKPLAPAPVVTPPMPVAIAPTLPVPASRPSIAAVPQASPAPASAVKDAMPARPPARPTARREPPATAPAAPPDDRIYTQAELPDAIRRELPRIAYGGGSYSADKASRIAFLNGQVFHEGDTVAPGLVLKQIKQKGAVLAYKGYRFELGS